MENFKMGGWLKKYQTTGEVNSELAKYMKTPVDPNDLRYVGNQQAVQDNTRVVVPNVQTAAKKAPTATAEIQRVNKEMKARGVSSPAEVYAQEKGEAQQAAAQAAAIEAGTNDKLYADNQSAFDKAMYQAYNIASNPLDALGHYNKYGYVQQGNEGNYGLRDDASPMGTAINAANPFAWLNAGIRLQDDLGKPETYTTLPGAANAAMDALEMLPMFTELRPLAGARMLADDAARAGKYLTEGPLRNAYKYNPKVLKENPEMFLYRAEPSNFNSQSTIDFMKQEVAAGRGKPWYKATIKSYEEGHPKLMAQNDFHGQWLEKDPARLDWYLNSGDKVDVGTPMSILRTKIPTSEAGKYSVANNAKANVISASPNTEFVMPRNIIEQGDKFPASSWQQLIQEDKAFNKPHWLKGFPKPTSISSSVDDVGKNLIDLQEAQKFAQQYGYELPANLERISQSNMLTDRTIRGMMDRHNTFVRGVSTNWDEIAKRNPEILRHLESKGIDWQNNPKAAAEYMATHIPINTGYGRASLNTEVFDRGLQGLYTSNSIPTAEGYTYGQGFITKVKKPTDFSSPNRQNWITKNNPHYRDEDKFRELMFPLSDETKYAIHSSKSKWWTPKSADEKLLKNATSKQKAIKEVEYRIEQLKKDISEIEPNKDKWIDAPVVIYSKKELVKQLENDIKYLEKHGDELLQAPGEFNLLRTERPSPTNYDNAFSFNSKLNEFIKSKGKDVMSSTKGTPEGEQLLQDIIELQKNNLTDNKPIIDYLQKNHPDFFEPNKYAHYIHLGTPGEKVLQPIKSWEITPEIWKNKSRAHTNTYSKKFSALEEGGIIKDDRGQWAHPGQVTEIQGNNMATHGYGDIPLYVVPDVGEPRIVEANTGNHTFPGATKFTEYPIKKKKNGGWLDKY